MCIRICIFLTLVKLQDVPRCDAVRANQRSLWANGYKQGSG